MCLILMKNTINNFHRMNFKDGYWYPRMIKVSGIRTHPVILHNIQYPRPPNNHFNKIHDSKGLDRLLEVIQI